MPLPPLNRRFARACVAGALAAALVFAWVLFLGRAELAPPRPAADFYDAQARALFHGRWDVPPEVLSIEAFEVDGRTYMYFGPVPALLRMPILAVTDALDGRLTQLSMLVAFAVTMLGVTRLSWRIRTFVRGDAAVHRREAVVTALFTFGAGAGTVVLYLGSQAVVYHEAILWGIAWALLAYDALIGFLVHPRVRTLAWASGFATLAFLTRASVGAGPVVALGLAVVAVAVARLAGDETRVPALVRAVAPGVEVRPATRLVGVGIVAVLVPLVLYAGVNLVKFGELYRLPLERQVFSDLDPARQAALADNDGSLFGLKFVPTTLWQAVRPDAIELQRAAPWITFPRAPADVIGDVTFDTLDESSSVTATMPLLVVLGVVGAVVVVRARPVRDAEVAALRLPVLGGVAGLGATLTIAFVAHRYLGDAFPPLLLLALAGLHACGRRFAGDLRPAVVATGVAFLVLGAWGVAANLGLAVEYQRLIAPTGLDTRYDFVAFQVDAPGDPPVVRTDEVPDVAARGTLLVLGDCDALFYSDGHLWYLLEGAPDREVLEGRPVVIEGARRDPELCHQLP